MSQTNKEKILNIISDIKQKEPNFNKVTFDGEYVIFSKTNTITPPLCVSIKDFLIYDYIKIDKNRKRIDITELYK